MKNDSSSRTLKFLGLCFPSLALKEDFQHLLSLVLLNPAIPATSVYDIFTQIQHNQISKDQVNVLIDKIRLPSIWSVTLRKEIRSKILEWENQIGSLDKCDWLYLYSSFPELFGVFPEKRIVSPFVLAKGIAYKIKGQDEALKELSLFLYEYYCY